MVELGSWRVFWRKHALVRLLALHALAGFALAAVFICALGAVDFGGIASMISRQGAWPVYVVLWLFCGLTFASVQMGIAVMSLERDGQDGGGKRARIPLQSARVRSAV